MPPGVLNSSATISRQSPLGTNGRTQLQQLYTNVACLVQPMNHTTAIELHFDIGRATDLFFAPAQDVKPEDVIAIGSQTFVIKAVQAYSTPFGVGYTVGHSEEVIN